jgi:prolyl-tRNA synthetase
MSDFVCGANETSYHFTGINFDRDLEEPETLDLRMVMNGDPSPLGKGKLNIARGIEVGHIFQLGTKYSEALNATVQDREGKDTPMAMGCYGIGVTRIVGAAIEQNHDDKGIIWPETLAPFQIIIIPIGLNRSEIVKKITSDLYNQMLTLGFEVLLDDRDVRPGVKFADAELIGIPHRVVISEKGIEKNNIEYRHRSNKDSEMITAKDLMNLLGNQK